jgi:DNA-binding NarL/FixJ family response regulator
MVNPSLRARGENWPPGDIVALCNDLFFSTRISTMAAKLGIIAHVIDTPSQLIPATKSAKPRLILIELGPATPAIISIIPRLREDHPNSKCIAFGPHVNADQLHKAREAGCTAVFPRSQFTTQLPHIMGEISRTGQDPDINLDSTGF